MRFFPRELIFTGHSCGVCHSHGVFVDRYTALVLSTSHTYSLFRTRFKHFPQQSVFQDPLLLSTLPVPSVISVPTQDCRLWFDRRPCTSAPGPMPPSPPLPPHVSCTYEAPLKEPLGISTHNLCICRSAAYFVIATPTSYASPKASAATQLMLKLVHDSLNETTYMADVAGLEYAVRFPPSAHMPCTRLRNRQRFSTLMIQFSSRYIARADLL